MRNGFINSVTLTVEARYSAKAAEVIKNRPLFDNNMAPMGGATTWKIYDMQVGDELSWYDLGGEDALDYFKYELRDALKAAGIPAKQFSINFN